MSKKKSLGSSPIGYSALSSGTSSYRFIPDLGVSSSRTSSSESSVSTLERKNTRGSFSGNKSDNDNDSEKKIASYYLEVRLIDRLKNMADDQESYYSSVASDAIHHWVDIHGY